MNEPNTALILFQMALVTYIISVGLGVIVAQERGARYVHRIWARIVTRIAAFFLNTIADLLRWSARAIRR